MRINNIRVYLEFEFDSLNNLFKKKIRKYLSHK